MNPGALWVYHRLPASLRSLAAAARGWQLQRWRYGPETEGLVAAALERERWTPKQWSTWREERLGFVLQRAATRVPYYRNYWERRRRAGDNASWEYLESWPVLEKDEVRTQPRAFLADDVNAARMFPEHTSGTTGTPIRLWWSRSTVRAWYALFEARWRRWHGVSSTDRWAILGGQLITPAGQRKPPFWVWNPALRQLYLSAYHLAPDLLPYYLEALEQYRIRYLYGYTSALQALAQGAIAAGGGPRVAVALTNAEPVYPHQRSAIAGAFSCPVRETYGMAEIVTAAGECEHGTMHLWPEVGAIEVLDGTHSSPESGGELVATGLMNADMPLIRYRTGDRVTLAAGRSCGCGRQLPQLREVEGRADDVLYTADGRAVGRLDPVFKAELAIHEAQIIQESLHLVRVAVVPAPGFGSADHAAIVSGLEERLPGVRVVVTPVRAIPRTDAGKLRAVVCRIPADQRPRSA